MWRRARRCHAKSRTPKLLARSGARYAIVVSGPAQGEAMQTVAHKGEFRRIREVIEEAGSFDRENDGGTIKGILWALAIVVPIYAVILWVLMSYSLV